MNKVQKKYLRLLPGLTVAILVIGVAIGVITFIDQWLEKSPKEKKVVQQISLIQPPPPPPPPEKIEEPPPEPEIEEEIKAPEPEPMPEDVPESPAEEGPIGDDLGLDAEGGAGGDAFGLAGRKGGRDLIGGGGSKYSHYSQIIQHDISSFLQEKEDVRSNKYSVLVKIWIDPDGRVKQFKLLTSSGDEKVDQALKTALASLKKMREAPPEDMPQPVKLKITSRS